MSRSMPTATAAMALAIMCLPGTWSFSRAELAALVEDGRRAREPLEAHVPGEDVGLGREAVGDEPPLELGDDALQVRVVEAEDDRAVERDLVGEADERLLDLLDVRIVVEVLGVDVGQDGDERGEEEERPVALVGFGDEEIPGSELGVGPEGVQPAADDDGRVEAGLVEEDGDHRRRRRLAVRAGHGDAVFHPHELGEHLRPGDDGDLAAAAPRRPRDCRCGWPTR